MSTRVDYEAETTVENLREQAIILDSRMRHVGAICPENRCKKLEDFVDRVRSGSTTVGHARMYMYSEGFLALATEEGIAYLLENY